MALSCVLIYIVLLSACGCFFLRKWKIEPLLLFPVGFVIGSILMGGGMFLLVSTGHVSPIPIIILVAGIAALGIFGIPTTLRSLKETKCFLCSHVYTGKYRVLLVILLFVGLVVYLASAYTPPRSGDAMRYHLAQIKETVKYGGFVYRPYYHYNFPQYFHYLFIPVFMLVGGVGVKLSVCFYSVLVVAVVLYLSVRTEQTKSLLFLALFLIFTPLYTREATTVNNDIPMIFYGLVGLLLLIEFKAKTQIRYLIIAYASLGFALGCKYQAVLYLPLYMLATFLILRSHWRLSLKLFEKKLEQKFRPSLFQRLVKYVPIIPLSIIPFLVASPFLIRNLHYTGDPFWPLLQDFFHVQKDYLYQVTKATADRWQGNIGPAALVRSIVSLGSYFHIIPIIWILWLGYYFTRFPSGLVYKAGTLLYFCAWFLLQPKIYPRFAIYILPVVAIMAISFCEWSYNKHSHFGKVPYIIAILSILLGIGVSILYSSDFLIYHLDRDLKQYHESTWFYDQYQWINQNLRGNGKLLVIVGSGHTYYIDAEYLRADPELSGLMDWTAIKSVEELRDELSKLQVRYIFYEDRNWSSYPGGSNMMRLMHDLKNAEGVSVLLEDNNVKLVTLRILGRFTTTKVFLLDVKSVAKPA
jgi:hypothetical protein